MTLYPSKVYKLTSWQVIKLRFYTVFQVYYQLCINEPAKGAINRPLRGNDRMCSKLHALSTYHYELTDIDVAFVAGGAVFHAEQVDTRYDLLLIAVV